MIIFKIHSLSNAITNSSTTVYVFDNDKTIEKIKEVIDNVSEIYRETKNHIGSYDLSVKTGKEIKERYEYYLNDWLSNKFLDKENYIVYEEAGDNSMPYEVEEFIGNLFNGVHIHLG